MPFLPIGLIFGLISSSVVVNVEKLKREAHYQLLSKRERQVIPTASIADWAKWSIRTTPMVRRHGCFGSINYLNPTGKLNGGVAASEREVRFRQATLDKFRYCYERVARENCIEGSLIGAIASRESNGGASLAADGTGDRGRAWGIMQCDMHTSGLPCKTCPARSCCHITMMVKELLVPFIKQVAKKHPSWTAAQQLQGGVAAYNFRVSNVRTWDHLDVGTAGNDYSNDVIARAKYLKQRGWS